MWLHSQSACVFNKRPGTERERLQTESQRAKERKMEGMLGLLRIRVKRGIDLAVHDSSSSDPYVVVSMGQQKLRTRMIKDNCNPEWDDELTLTVHEPVLPFKLTVFDKDTFTGDDNMGEVEVNLKTFVDCAKIKMEPQPAGAVIKSVHPDTDDTNLSEISHIYWNDKGKLVQDMMLKLKNTTTGQVEIQIEWIDVPASTSG